jgi:hypothetical protein
MTLPPAKRRGVKGLFPPSRQRRIGEAPTAVSGHPGDRLRVVWVTGVTGHRVIDIAFTPRTTDITDRVERGGMLSMLSGDQCDRSLEASTFSPPYPQQRRTVRALIAVLWHPGRLEGRLKTH